ncbi:MAG: DUF177 domain-containing protein [Deltaproteobacteria bacterium]|nr:DUF177 domain-containing protein [Deltaproteobacteria bacterium]
MKMKLNIDDIGDGGLRVKRELDGESVRKLLTEAKLELLAGEAFARLDVELRRMDTTIFVRGALEARFVIACSRCLGPASMEIEEKAMRLTFLPRAAWASMGEELELGVEDLDTYTHDGESIDLGVLVREQLVLTVPIAPLCHEGCTGIERMHEGDPSAAAGWQDALKRIKETMNN